jgi:hypothetical protein
VRLEILKQRIQKLGPVEVRRRIRAAAAKRSKPIGP